MSAGNWTGDYMATTTIPLNTVIAPGNFTPIAINLQTQSENINGWAKTNATVGSNVIANPVDGAVTADSLIDDTTNGQHVLSAPTAVYTLGKVMTLSAYLKAGSQSWAILAADNAVSYMNVNLQTGAIGTLVGANVIRTYTEPMPDGWYRCVLTYLSSNAPGTRIYAETSDNGFVYAGTGVAALYAYGVQIVQGNRPGPYFATESTSLGSGTSWRNDQISQNLLLQSQTFDSVSWSKQANVIVTPNQATAPDGTLTADLIDFTTAGADFGTFQQVSTTIMPQVPGRYCTSSVWLRAVSGTTTCKITNVSIIGTVVCDLTTEWKRFSLTEFPSQPGLAIRNNAAGTTGQIYAWGAQFNVGNIAQDYVPTTTVAVNSTFGKRNLA